MATQSTINQPNYLIPTRPSDKREFLTVQEAAWLLNVAVTTIYKWIKDKKLRAYRAGKQWRLLRTDIYIFMRVQMVEG